MGVIELFPFSELLLEEPNRILLVELVSPSQVLDDSLAGDLTFHRSVFHFTHNTGGGGDVVNHLADFGVVDVLGVEGFLGLIDDLINTFLEEQTHQSLTDELQRIERQAFSRQTIKTVTLE
ncbi:hypothetical protein D3C81_1816440 [compost metagenome]